MPFSRGKKPNVTSSKIPKLHAKGMENQEDGPQVKRSSSPPQGAPKKRTAFIDLTNAHKIQLSNPIKKKGSTKKVQKKTTAVSAKKQANLKKSTALSLELQPEELKQGQPLAKEPAEPPPNDPLSACLQPPQVPEEFDIDTAHLGDCSMTAEYAKDIFDYLKSREEKFVLQDYLPSQPGLNKSMRAILVDWMVEVQENLELNHETLYLAVKLTDHYLASTPVSRESLQLIGSTAMLISSKFEERMPPCVDDFHYICDDAYKHAQIIAMEATILQALQFDISIPVPYSFLRRYGKCVNASMETLTLARYVCELSLLELEFVPERASLLAASCLLIALVTKDLGGWSPILHFHSGYDVCELAPLVRKLHAMLSSPPDSKLVTIRIKYSHKVFFEVAKIPTMDIEKLEGFLK